jgi:hypothetical protein
MEQLEDLMERLNSDKFCAVTIYDNDKSQPIYRNYTHEQIQNEHGTSQAFFESLYDEGYTKLSIQERRKNGVNAFKNESDVFEVSFGEQSETPIKKVKKAKKKAKKKSGLMGLGMAEIFDLKLQAHDRGELLRKLQESEKENKELKTKNEQLLEDELLRKYTKESNDSLNNMLLGVVKQAPLILKGLGFNVPVESSGLAVASPEDLEDMQYSESKRHFLDLAKTLDDDMLELLQVIYQKINEKSADNVFPQELFELLQKHQMIAT